MSGSRAAAVVATGAALVAGAAASWHLLQTSTVEVASGNVIVVFNTQRSTIWRVLAGPARCTIPREAAASPHLGTTMLPAVLFVSPAAADAAAAALARRCGSSLASPPVGPPAGRAPPNADSEAVDEAQALMEAAARGGGGTAKELGGLPLRVTVDRIPLFDGSTCGVVVEIRFCVACSVPSAAVAAERGIASVSAVAARATAAAMSVIRKGESGEGGALGGGCDTTTASVPPPANVASQGTELEAAAVLGVDAATSLGTAALASVAELARFLTANPSSPPHDKVAVTAARVVRQQAAGAGDAATMLGGGARRFYAFDAPVAVAVAPAVYRECGVRVLDVRVISVDDEIR